ncbi:hypothetical protein E4T48_06284 [Aureobasidium sp. EXF-10727]|nr:hypothetical protein E4T48_06284 [Aureobasidium sp. EXF-10727]
MLVLRLPLRLAVRATPYNARVATPVVASSLSAARSYRTKADGTTSPKKADGATSPKKRKTAAPALSKKAQKEAAAKAAYKLLSPEEKAEISARAKQAKQKEEAKLLKAQALEPPKYRQVNAWAFYIKDKTAAKHNGPVTDQVKALSQDFKNLSSSEKENLDQRVIEHNAKSLREFQEWLNSHTPAQILEANNVRSRLRKLLADSKTKYWPIKDDRLVKKPTTSFIKFHNERIASGEYHGSVIAESAKRIAAEFKALSASEKKKYEDLSAKDVERYNREHLEVYGFEAPPAKVNKKALDAAEAGLEPSV